MREDWQSEREQLEFITDLVRETKLSGEYDRLGQAGTLLAAELLANEDFSDWEKGMALSR